MLSFRPRSSLLVLRLGQAVTEELQIIRQAYGGQQLCLGVLELLLCRPLSVFGLLKIHRVCRVLLWQTQPLDIFYDNV